MRITNDLIDAASKAYAEKRHPGRWDGEPWGIAGRENHRRAIKAALRSAFGVIKKRKPKIKLTKTLPSEEGRYYYQADRRHEIEIVDVEVIDGVAMINTHIALFAISNIADSRWAKVEQDHFEFEEGGLNSV